MSWDLSQTLVAPRPLALGFDPFAQARALLRAASPDTLVTRDCDAGAVARVSSYSDLFERSN